MKTLTTKNKFRKESPMEKENKDLEENQEVDVEETSAVEARTGRRVRGCL